MNRRRKPLSFTQKNEQVESELEKFVLSGVNNANGKIAWQDSTEIQVELDKILLPEFQIRAYYDREKIEQIKATISAFGIKEPLLLRPHPQHKDYFELIAGSQRRLAAKELGLNTVPGKVDEVDNLAALKIAIFENEARSDLNPYEKARATLNLIKLALDKNTENTIEFLIALFNAENRGTDKTGIILSQESQIVKQIFNELGLSWKSFVTNKIPLFKLPIDIKESLEKGEIEYTKAIRIAKIKDEKDRMNLLSEVINAGLSINEINLKISQLQSTESKNETQILRSRARIAWKKVTSAQMMKNPKHFKQIKKIVDQLETIVEKAEKVDS